MLTYDVVGDSHLRIDSVHIESPIVFLLLTHTAHTGDEGSESLVCFVSEIVTRLILYCVHSVKGCRSFGDCGTDFRSVRMRDGSEFNFKTNIISLYK